MIPKDTLYRYTTDTAVVELLEKRKLSFRDPENWDDKNDSRLFKKYEEKNNEKAFAICMTRSSETFHHWSVFSKKNIGMRISFNEREIIQISNKNKFQHGNVKYIQLTDLYKYQNISDLRKLFLKRYAYRDEREFRIISISKNQSAPELSVDPSSIIQKITFSPWMEIERKKYYKDKFSEISPNITISETSLIDNKTWRDFADGKQIPTLVR